MLRDTMLKKSCDHRPTADDSMPEKKLLREIVAFVAEREPATLAVLCETELRAGVQRTRIVCLERFESMTLADKAIEVIQSIDGILQQQLHEQRELSQAVVSFNRWRTATQRPRARWRTCSKKRRRPEANIRGKELEPSGGWMSRRVSTARCRNRPSPTKLNKNWKLKQTSLESS